MPAQDLPITSYALMGLLTFGDELTGYELKQRADNTLRFYWQSPAMSQVYSELARLTDEGLLHRRGQGRGTTYTLTARGRLELESWMDDTDAGFPIFKHPQALRLMIGHLSDPGRLTKMLESYLEDVARARTDLLEVRESLRGADAAGQPFRYPSLVADWGLAHFESEKAIAEQVIDRLREDETVETVTPPTGDEG
ncbi:PadR family transcriptional regulator [Nocardioides houyundeii]|uniref:PadR family transcriptional regulator n=1 Tax=Nocardioides houyundeii TaxID=2045452 RepID=UPI000DF1AC9D|nr:PadR family transcriptional regulator [Nocardioides houyundeii]